MDGKAIHKATSSQWKLEALSSRNSSSPGTAAVPLVCVRIHESHSFRIFNGQNPLKFYVVAILLGVFVMGFLTDMFGIGIAHGPFWLGLVIPNGPPLGATLV